jgi:Ulp1 family protease
MFDNDEWALFSTYVIPIIRTKRKDDDVWRNTKKTKFWKRHNWIIPIHRRDESHWVLAIVDVSNTTILLFDSFAQGETTWSQDLLVQHSPSPPMTF